MEAIIKVRNQLRKERPQTDTIDAWNYLKYRGYEDLSLTALEKRELESYGNEIKAVLK